MAKKVKNKILEGLNEALEYAKADRHNSDKTSSVKNNKTKTTQELFIEKYHAFKMKFMENTPTNG